MQGIVYKGVKALILSMHVMQVDVMSLQKHDKWGEKICPSCEAGSSKAMNCLNHLQLLEAEDCAVHRAHRWFRGGSGASKVGEVCSLNWLCCCPFVYPEFILGLPSSDHLFPLLFVTTIRAKCALCSLLLSSLIEIARPFCFTFLIQYGVLSQWSNKPLVTIL